jgi:hypothetical protein
MLQIHMRSSAGWCTSVTDDAHKHIPPTTGLRSRGIRLWAAMILMLATAVSSALAQTPPAERSAPSTAAPPPQPATETPLKPAPYGVVALITSYGNMDAVSLCFPKAIDHDQATAIVKHMADLGGWEPVGLVVEDERYRSLYDELEKTGSPGVMQTYVDFSAFGVINQRNRWIPLDPFIVPLKGFSPIRLAFAIGGQVIVEGPGDYGDNTVQIECNRQPDSIVYDITVKDPDLTSTRVPAAPPAGQVRPAPAPVKRGSALPWLAILAALVVISAGTAFGLWRLWRGKVSWSSTAKRVTVKPDVGAPESEHESG